VCSYLNRSSCHSCRVQFYSIWWQWWNGPIGHFARNSSCSPFRLLCIYCLPSKFVSRLTRWPLITLIHVAENPCRTLHWNPTERGGGRGGREAEDECYCGWLLVSHIKLLLLRPLLSYFFSLLAVTVVTSFCADYCKYPFFVFFFVKSDDFMSFAFSGRLNWRICWTLFCSKTFYRSNFTPHSGKQIPNLFQFYQVKLSFQFRQMQLSMSLLYGWLWKIEWSLRSPSALEARLWVSFSSRRIWISLTNRSVNSKSQLSLFLY
jgi:hypothetical protein